MAEWNRQHPNSFFGLVGEGRALIAERKFKEALTPLEKAALLHSDYGEPGGPYILQAQAYRELGAPRQEKQMLEKHVALNAEAVDARVRLIELATQQKDWPAVRTHAEAVLAVNPLLPGPHRALAEAAGGLGDRQLAIEALRTLLLLDPLDLADHHYRLATLLNEENRLLEARRHVLMALEEAPRFRDAHRLLLKIVATMPSTAPQGRTDPRPATNPLPPRAVPGPTPAAPAPAEAQ
jgi:tetratricopeptide (TPR) repeat protein